MTPGHIFGTVNLVARGAWVVLALSPWIPRATAIAGAVVPALLAAVYAALIGTNWLSSEGGFGSFDDLFAGDDFVHTDVTLVDLGSR
jgi:hypothetical protein